VEGEELSGLLNASSENRSRRRPRARPRRNAEYDDEDEDEELGASSRRFFLGLPLLIS